MIRRQILATLALAGFALILLGYQPAYAEEIYTVPDVTVEGKGNSASAARDDAISKGQVDAFNRLLQQIDPVLGKTKAAKYTPDQIANTVRGFEVMNEKMTNNSYKATLKITFDPQQIQIVLTQGATTPPVGGTAAANMAGISTTPAYAPAPAAPTSNYKPASMLVLPVMLRPNGQQLWEPENNWRSIWNSVALQKGGGRLIVPFGDPNDISMMDASRAIAGSYPMFQQIAERYGANEIAVMQVSVDSMAIPAKAKVHIRRVTPGGINEDSILFDGKPGETPESLMIRAAQQIAMNLQKEQEIANTAPEEQINSMTLLAHVTSLRDWNDMRRHLETVPMITGTELSALSFRQADIVVHYRGSAQNLAKGMMAQGLQLTPAGQFWAIALP